MLAAILALVTALDSALGALDAAEVWAQIAIDSHTQANWGSETTYKNAMAFWTLHNLSVNQTEAGGGAGVAGPLLSERTMDVSVTYAAVGASRLSNDDADYSRTMWGRRYLALRKSRARGHAGLSP